MACQGAEPPTEKEVDSLLEEILTYLAEKHRLCRERNHPFPRMREYREECKVQLREALKEILTLRNYEEF